MALSPTAMSEVDSVLKGAAIQIWRLPISFPKAGLHAPAEELGLNIPTVWEYYCGSAIRSWTQILRRGRARHRSQGLHAPSIGQIKNWPLELAFHTHKIHATCLSVIGRNAATLITADLHPLGDTEIWSGNQILTSITTQIPITMDEDGCPTKDQAFPQSTKILHKLVPLWEHSIHNWE
jgi:hypothetical protein